MQDQTTGRSLEPAFFQLVVWQKAQLVASEVVRVVDAIPSSRSAATICNQLLRSAGSVPANIAEGYGRYSDPAFRNHLSIARGSLFETESWIDLLLRSGHINGKVAQELINSCEEVARMLTASMKQISRRRSLLIREEESHYVLNPEVS